MKLLLAVALLSAANPAFAQTAFDGTWKVDVASAKLSTKPDVFAIKDGIYTCSTCTPAVRTMADGKVHAVPGHDYFDALSVTVIDPTKVRYVYMRGGKVTSDSTDTIGADGATIASEWISTDNAKGDAVAGRGVMKRVGPAPAGAHATSGSWIRTNDVQLSDKVLTMTLKVVGDKLTLIQPTGETYTATFGGPQVPLVGDPAKTMIAIRKTSANTIVETDYRRGKPVNRFTMIAQPDGTLRFVATDLKINSTNEFIGVKQ